MTDVFQWANKVDADKHEYDFELFFFNKNYTPYATQFGQEMAVQFRSLFLFGLLNDVLLGAGTGLMVKEFDMTTIDQNVLWAVETGKVGRLDTLIHLIETQRDDIVFFNQNEHEMKRIQGAIGVFTHKVTREKFYVTKSINGSAAMTDTALQMSQGFIEQFRPDVAFRIGSESQSVTVDGSTFVFRRNQFEKLFKYEYVKYLQADKAADELVKRFKIVVPSDIGGELGNIVRESSALLKKVIEVDPQAMTPEEVMAVADDMQLELMTDDNDGIIIMNKDDLNVFLNILSDNYFESGATGKHYVAKTKKEIETAVQS